MTAIDPRTLPFLPVEPGNTLVLTDAKSAQRKGMDNDDDFYEEVNAEGMVVAKYHVWHYLNIYPPQNVDHGWRKTLPDGEFIAAGKKA
ncbi:MAG: hypothetical protein Q8O29_01035 [Polaromonas sp.]|uniref:hypothetical protein n=1 Tax=Polaromonas sp. TaxID=1869339 RepID=UPI0027352453|nr:hypothetical protein [Polaromonas sp.]MDP2816863.1 hypothetical protein [Polaromonas sp.]